MPRVASSVERVPYSGIRELAEIAMGMEGVLRLYFGESNLPTPDYIKDAAERAMREGYTFYTENAGLPSLRRAIAESYRKLHQVEIDPAGEIVITASGVQALNVAIRSTLDPGDEALLLTPAWPNGSSIVALSNAVARQIPHPLCGNRYAIDFDALEAAMTDRTRLLVYISPSNPLGWVATQTDQERLLDFARRHGLWLLADEVYDRLSHLGGRLGEPAASILRLASRDDAVIVVQSFSKAYRMALGLPDRAARPGGEGGSNERIHRFARCQLHAESRRDRAGGWRGGTSADAGGLAGEPGPVSGSAARHAGSDGSGARWRVLCVSADCGSWRFLCVLPASAGRDPRGAGARGGVRRRRRGLGAHLLRGGTVDPRTRHGAASKVLETGP
jgi:hypothetical protein